MLKQLLVRYTVVLVSAFLVITVDFDQYQRSEVIIFSATIQFPLQSGRKMLGSPLASGWSGGNLEEDQCAAPFSLLTG